MAQSVAASAVGAAAAFLQQRSMNGLRGLGACSVGSQGKRAFSAQSPFFNRTPCSSPRNLVVFNSDRSASYGSGTRRFFGTVAGAPASYMLVDKPRPTEYQTEICNEATGVKPGVEKSSTVGLVVLTTLLIVVPIVHTKYELHKYYSEYGHLYKTGWDLYHYDKRKSTYLS